MVTVVQVDRHLVPAKRRGDRWQVISEANDSGFAVFSEQGWGWILTIETPDVRWREIRMKRVQASLS